MEREYFNHPRFRVTADIVRARRRSIQLSTIEGVEITRPLFFMALAGCAGVAGVGLVFGDLLYLHEIAIFLLLAGGVMTLAWKVGELRVFSKLTRNKGWAVYWWIDTLHPLRDAIENAMLDRARPKEKHKDREQAPPPPALPDDDDLDSTIRRPRSRG